MPITGTFLADFSAFKAAVDGAEIKLKGLETGAGRVATSINKVADSFSGRTIVQNAEIATAAVLQMQTKLGGALGLTATEQTKLNRQLEEAIAKYRALGQEAPADMLKLAAATKQAETATGGLGEAMGSVGGAAKALAGGLGLAFGAQAIIGGIKSLVGGAIEMASAIDDNSKKLGVSAEKYQGWVAAAKLAGGTAEDVAGAVGKMNVNLDEGSKKTVDALKAIGLSFQEVRSMKPEEAFEAIATALMKIKDPMEQAAAARALFGKGADAILAAIKDDIVAVGNAADKMSNETVARLDAAGDAWTKFGQAATIVTGEVLAGVEHLVTTSMSSWKKFFRFAAEAAAGGVGFAIGVDNAREVADQGSSTGDVGPSSADFLRSRRQHQTAEDAAAAEAALKKAAAAAEAYAKKVREAADAMSGAKIGADLKVITDGLALMSKEGKGLTEGEFVKLGKILVDAKAAGVPLTAQLEEMYVAYINLHSPIAALYEPIGKLLQAFPDLSGSMKESERGALEFSKGVESLSKGLAKLEVPITRMLPQLKLHLDPANAALLAVDTATQKFSGDTVAAVRYMMAYGLTVDQAVTALEKYGSITKEQGDALRTQTKETVTLDKALGDLSQSFAILAQVGGGAFDGIAKDLGTMIAAINTAESSLKAIDALLKDMGGPNAKGLSPKAKAYAESAIVGEATGAEVVSATGIRNKTAGTLVGAGAGAAAGAMYGSVVPGVGTAIGAGVGAIAGAIGGYLAARKAAKEYEAANKAATDSIATMEKQLVSQYGRLEDIDRMGKQVGVDLIGAWGAQGVEGLQKFQALTDEFQKKMGLLTAAVEKFGLTWRDMRADQGLEEVNKQAAALGDQLHVLYTAGFDWGKVMEKAGADVLAMLSDIADAGGTIPESLQSGIVVLGRMGTISDKNADALNAYLGHAMAAGQKIPAALEPVIEKLIRMGKLTEENARAMLGLGAETGPVLADVKAAADRYGLTIDQLGGKVQQLDINDKAKQLVGDWNTLTTAGADVGSVMAGMKDQVQGLVSEALKFGQKIPESMKPMLQAMVDAGDLVDADGQKMTDLSGLSFSEDLTKKIGDLVDVLQKMFDGMSDGVSGSSSDWRTWADDVKKQADAAAGGVEGAFAGASVTVPVHYAVDAPPGAAGVNSYDPSTWNTPPVHAAAGAVITPAMVQYYAGGGGVWRPRGSDTVPAMLTPGERVLSVSDARSYDARGAAGASPTTIIIQALDSQSVAAWLRQGTNARTLAEGVVPHVPAVVRRYGLDR